jgi:multidrug efflux pump subunit AcrA (membrane-fusion protein)
VLAQTNERRYRSLLETGDVPQAQYDEIKARADTAQKTYEATLAKAKAGGAGIEVASSGVEAARANLDLAKKALADTVITAPLSGYVAERPAAVGEWLTNTSKIATIVQVDTLKLMLNVAESDAARIRMGMSVKLRVDAFPEREFGGNVAAIIPALDPSSRSLVVQVDVPNPGGDRSRARAGRGAHGCDGSARVGRRDRVGLGHRLRDPRQQGRGARRAARTGG